MSRQQQDTLEQEQYEMESKAAICKAMALAFPKIAAAVRDRTNPHFNSKYADIGAVIEAIKPALTAHGLWFSQVSQLAEKGVTVETILWHESGECISMGPLFVPATKQDAQGFGSALTYCRRYSLMTAFGVPAEDDDGNAAVKPAPVQQASSAPAPMPKIEPKRYAFLVAQFKNTESTSDLTELWKEMSPDERKAMADAKDAAKQRLQAMVSA